MSINIDLPFITGASTAEQVAQMKSYLFQMAQQLQWAFSTVGESRASPVLLKSNGEALENQSAGKKSAVQTFNELKALIIKSADIVEAYYETIDSLLATSGKYLAASVFGTFQEEVSQRIGADHQSLMQAIERVETIGSHVDGVDNRLKTQQAYLRYGSVGTSLDDSHLADTNAPGIEIGDYQMLSDGTSQTVNRRFARFTAYGLELFGENRDTSPVAYIKQNKLYITNAEIVQSLRVGGFQISNADGLSFDWVGV